MSSENKWDWLRSINFLNSTDMKTLDEDWTLVCELFEAWAEEAKEAVTGIFISSLNKNIGWAELTSNCIAFTDLKNLENDLTANGFIITLIGRGNDCMEIWFGIKQ